MFYSKRPQVHSLELPWGFFRVSYLRGSISGVFPKGPFEFGAKGCVRYR